VDSSGSKIWSAVVGGTEEEGSLSLTNSPDGGCYLYANTLSTDYDCITNHGSGDMLIARIDGNGNKLWAKCYGGSGNDGGFGAIIPNGNGGALVVTAASSSDGDIQNHIGDYDFWLVSLDSNGSINWSNCYGGPTHPEWPNAVCIANDGNIWLGGTVPVTGGQVGQTYGDGDAWIVQLDTGGNFLNSVILGTSEADIITMLHPLSNGLIFAGGTYAESGSTGAGLPNAWYGGLDDLFLAKVAPWTTNVTTTQNASSIEVYPVPATTELSIKISNREAEYLTIRDVLGREVYKTSQLEEKTGIDVSQWPRGVYYLHVMISGKPSIKSLVLQ
jgi:hypothetical protein